VSEPYKHALRVRYAECDMQGVVFNAHYLAYFDANITELWRAAFGSYQAMLDRGIDMVLAEAQLRFRSPARFDDELTLAVAVAHLGTTSFVTEHSASRGDQMLAEGTLRHVLIERDTLVKTPIPDWARAALAAWTVPSAGAGERPRASPDSRAV
jgi:acyl-CoA thioester hydrolase